MAEEKAIGKEITNLSQFEAYKRRRRLLNKTENSLLSWNKKKDWRQFTIVSFTPRHFPSLSLQESLLDYYKLFFLIYLFDVSCINNRNSLIRFYSRGLQWGGKSEKNPKDITVWSCRKKRDEEKLKRFKDFDYDCFSFSSQLIMFLKSKFIESFIIFKIPLKSSRNKVPFVTWAIILKEISISKTMQLTRKQQENEVLEVHNGSLQKVFSRLIRWTHGSEASTLGKFKTWMNIKSHVGTHKRLEKVSSVSENNFTNFCAKDFIKLFTFFSWNKFGTKALHRDLMESTMVTGIILSLDKNAVIVRLKQRPRHSVVGKQFCSFLFFSKTDF